MAVLNFEGEPNNENLIFYSSINFSIMRTNIFFNLLIVFTLFSCQNNEFENIVEVSNNSVIEGSYKVSVDEAKDIALQFMDAFQKTSAASTRGVKLAVDDVEVIKVNKMATRSAGMENGMDTLLYAVNFSNNEGYALIGADKRTEPVFGIIDKGSFSSEHVATNPNFAFFLDLALGKVLNDIIQNDTINYAATRALSDYENIFATGFSLMTKWGQSAPYNQYCPGPYTGCVAVALSQIIERYQAIGSVSWQDNSAFGSATLHWNQIFYDYIAYDGRLDSRLTPQSASEVAHLMRYIGVALKAEYKSDGTSMHSDDAIDWINDWTGLKATELKEYNAIAVLNDASTLSDKLVYMIGYSDRKKFLWITTKYTGGHAWVADGAFSAVRKSDRRSVNLFHFNWGWDGYSNGYFLASVFDSSTPAITDAELPGVYRYSNNSPRSRGNYQYKVQYSIVEDPMSSGGGVFFH